MVSRHINKQGKTGPVFIACNNRPPVDNGFINLLLNKL
jgi:hypothetical protein